MSSSEMKVDKVVVKVKVVVESGVMWKRSHLLTEW
jgi:hypothetical protein